MNTLTMTKVSEWLNKQVKAQGIKKQSNYIVYLLAKRKKRDKIKEALYEGTGHD